MVGGQSAFVELTKIFDQCRFATGGTVARMVWRKMKVKRASGIGTTRIVAQTSEMMMTGVALRCTHAITAFICLDTWSCYLYLPVA